MTQNWPAVSPWGQASEAYRQMRRSLVKFAQIEQEYLDREEDLTPTQKEILSNKMNFWRERVNMFAAVYHVEQDVLSHTQSNIR